MRSLITTTVILGDTPRRIWLNSGRQMLRRVPPSMTVMLLVMLLSGPGCHTITKHRPPDLTITSENLGAPLVGFGAEFNPYLYCHPNWGDVTETNVKDLETKVIALHPQYVRIFMQLE